MNFISHYRSVMDLFAQDRRITGLHLALYQGLFYFWNLNRFPESFPIARDDIMKYAHIGSVNTYTKLIKDLDAWKYLSYRPTTDPRYRTEVCLYRFDKGAGKGVDKGPAKRIDNGVDTGTGKGAVQPLLNSTINEVNDTNELNDLNDYAPAKEDIPLVDSGNKNPGENDEPVPERSPGDNRGGGAPRSLEEVKAYFIEKKFSLREAEKFYNYFGSVGWTVGKSQHPMRDWRLGANNWMLNVKQTDDEQRVKPGDIRVPKDRDYQQPL
jgi:hypothetical protein